MERLIIRPAPDTRAPRSRRSFGRPAALRLKVAVLAFACVGAMLLGIASATAGGRLFGPGTSTGRTVSLHEFQVILQHQADACVQERADGSVPTPVAAR